MIKVLGTGSYLPEKILTNFDLEKIVDTTDAWIKQRTGISERHIAGDDEATSDLGAKAALKALAASNLTPKDIELIILGTSTPDYPIPASAPIIQKKLGCGNIFAFDINSVCTSFTTAFFTAASMLQSGFYNNALVIGSDTYSRILNWKDRGSCVIFGDGAGALVLTKDSTKKGIISSAFNADGSGADYIKIPAGGSKNPLRDIKNYKIEDLLFQMEGKKVYEFTISCIPEMAEVLVKKSKLTSNEIDWVILHQANLRIIDAVAKRLVMPKEKFIVNIDKVGNTSSASIPIALDEAVRSGKIKRGDKIMTIGFGGGLSWGGFIFEW